MKTILALFISILFFFSPASAQEKRDTMVLKATAIAPDTNRVTIEVIVKPYGNPGFTYFRYENDTISYGVQSFNGQSDTETYSFPLTGLRAGRVYRMRFFSSTHDGKLLNNQLFEFKTPPSSNVTVDRKKRKR